MLGHGTLHATHHTSRALAGNYGHETLNHMFFFSFAAASARLLSYSMATWTPQYMNVRSTNSSTPEDFSRILVTKLFATYVDCNYTAGWIVSTSTIVYRPDADIP